MSETILQEEWRPVDSIEGCEGYHGYEVSNLGRARSYRKNGPGGKLAKTARILKPSVSPKLGYLYVTLYRNRKPSRMFLHRLVLRAFVGPCPEGMETRHFPSNDPKNNRVDNLCWGTHEQNVQDRADMGMDRKGVEHGRAILNDDQVRAIRRRRVAGERNKDLADEYGVSKQLISAIHTRALWKHI